MTPFSFVLRDIEKYITKQELEAKNAGNTLVYNLSKNWSRAGTFSLRPLRLRVAVTITPDPDVGSSGSEFITCQWSNKHWGNALPPV